MKQLVCEMCGSSDLVKKDGVFVCQFCGTKYSTEEARKMMIDGSVDVSGSTVKVDTSDELANLYQIARRAKDDNNGENAAKYYDMILVKDPTSWEASFYVVYFKAMECKIAQIRSAAISVANCEDSVLGLIRDHVPEEEQASAVLEVVSRSKMIATMLAKGAESHYNGIDSSIKNNYTQEFLNNVTAARDIMDVCGTYVEKIFDGREDIVPCSADAWKAAVEINKIVIPYNIVYKASTLTYVMKIAKYDQVYANRYYNDEKKANLNSEIQGLKNTINNTPTSPKCGCFSIFMLVIGGIFLMLLLAGLSVGAGEVILGCSSAGIICVLLGIACIGPKGQKLKDNQNKVEEAKKQLAEKEAELAKLGK